jgi:hypothetical protein
VAGSISIWLSPVGLERLAFWTPINGTRAVRSVAEAADLQVDPVKISNFINNRSRRSSGPVQRKELNRQFAIQFVEDDVG